ncbi:hypothetical protein [Helicobacter sp. T3_23-1056]
MAIYFVYIALWIATQVLRLARNDDLTLSNLVFVIFVILGASEVSQKNIDLDCHALRCNARNDGKTFLTLTCFLCLCYKSDTHPQSNRHCERTQ